MSPMASAFMIFKSSSGVFIILVAICSITAHSFNPQVDYF